MPIDAGKLVSDNGKVEGYRNYFESFFWLLHMGVANAPLCNIEGGGQQRIIENHLFLLRD